MVVTFSSSTWASAEFQLLLQMTFWGWELKHLPSWQSDWRLQQRTDGCVRLSLKQSLQCAPWQTLDQVVTGEWPLNWQTKSLAGICVHLGAVSGDWLQWSAMNLCTSWGFLKIDCSGQQWVYLWAVSDDSADREAKLMVFHLLTMMVDLIQLRCWKIGPSQRHTCHTSEVVSSWVTLQSCQVSKWVLNQEHLQKLADCHWKMASLWTIKDELTILLVGPAPLYQMKV
jgi:hypothetical protein